MCGIVLMWRSTGGIVIALLQELYKIINDYKFDVVLVSLKRETFAAIQVERDRYFQREKVWDRVLSPKLQKEAEKLYSLIFEII